MEADRVRVNWQIDGDDLDAEEQETLGRALFAELREADPDIELVAGTTAAPDGSKSGPIGEFLAGEFDAAFVAVGIHAVVVVAYEYVIRNRSRIRRLVLRGPRGQTVTIPDMSMHEAQAAAAAWGDAPGRGAS